MRKALQRAVLERGGIATFSSDAGDEAAQEILEAIAAALIEPMSPADDQDDAIGICAGTA
jgi:hypothetical protein